VSWNTGTKQREEQRDWLTPDVREFLEQDGDQPVHATLRSAARRLKVTKHVFQRRGDGAHFDALRPCAPVAATSAASEISRASRTCSTSPKSRRILHAASARTRRERCRGLRHGQLDAARPRWRDLRQLLEVHRPAGDDQPRHVDIPHMRAAFGSSM